MSEMPSSTFRIYDSELGLSDIQSLSNADEITAFFARLGYNTDTRISQTPANLGITAEGTARPIKKIELIADQESFFQVYLFELTSVTVAHTRALARTFRNRAGNYLLVLTSDYERLDFVLLEKYVPAKGDDSSTIAQQQIGVRPRVLTVERRKPTRIQLRVLRRFTWTESDPFAQYDKLLSAYAVADWSEEFFNNRALFSDYYLLERFCASSMRERLRVLLARKKVSSEKNSWSQPCRSWDSRQGRARSLEAVQSSRTIDCIPLWRHQDKRKVRLYNKPRGRCASCIRGGAPWMVKTTNVTRRLRKKILAQ
jgi:hypothetical protein